MGSIAGFVQETDGSYSATRLGFLAWVLGVLGAWLAASLAKQSLQPVPESVAAILGVLMTGKVVQRFGEKPSIPPAPPAPQNVVVSGQTVVEGQKT
jgi:hypothetical protein